MTFASISLAMGVAAVLGLAVFGTGGDASQFPIQASRWMADVDGTLPKLLRIGWGTVLATGIMLPALACAALLASITKSPLLTLAGSLLTLAADAGTTAILWAWAQTDLASAQTAGTLKEWTFWSSRDLFGHHGTLTLLSEGTGDLGRTLGFSLVLLALALLVLQRRDIR